MHLKGSCACGRVTFNVDGEPIIQLYCHCRSCQLAHAAPLIAGAIFPARSVTYQGEARMVTVTGHADAARRLTCTNCGTRILNEPTPQFRAIFPALCETADWFKPQFHVQWQDHVLDVQDDLPKFLDFPQPMGGTGSMV